ncbi:amino acid adenylation domain-containing protein [Oxalobacteraceae bacterium GrIS 1.11]
MDEVLPGGRAVELASPAQRSLWFLTQLAPGAQRLHIRVELRWQQAPSPTALAQCLSRLQERHAILRTTFHRLPWGAIEQRRDSAAPWVLETRGDYPQWAVQQNFDLEHQPGIKAWLDGATLVLAVHRMVADCASVDILLADLLRADGAALPSAPQGPRFDEVAAAQLARLDEGACGVDTRYWLAKLAHGSPALALALDHPRTAARTWADAQVEIQLDGLWYQGLQAFCQLHAVRPEQALRAAFAVLLYRHTAQENIRMATLDAGRDGALAALVGPLENLLVSSLTLAGSLSFAALLRQVRDEDAANLAHAGLPFARLLESLNADGMQKHALPFQAAYVWRASHEDIAAIHQVELHIDEDQSLRVDLLLRVSERGGGLTLTLAYAASLFQPATAAALLERLLVLLRQALAAPQARLDALQLLDQDELERLSAPWPAPFYQPLPVHQLMEGQLARHGARPALVCGDATLSHQQMHAAANRLARHLRAIGVTAETRVGVALERGVNLIVALLAVFKAGGALVPIDPAYPAERIRHLLDDAAVTCLLTQEALLAKLPATGCTILLDTLDLSAMPAEAPAVAVAPEQLAYIIYTSGSTGRPKGVAVAHGPLSLHCQATADLYEMSAQSRELHFLSISFDGAHERWIVPLLAGGCVVLRPAALWSAAETHAALRAQRINNAGFPTSYLQQLAQWAEGRPSGPPLRLLSFGGEGMPRATFEQVKRALAPDCLINGYGPTETVISPLAWKVAGDASFEGAFAPIGRAVGPRRAYVLDADLNPLPPGVAGELYIGGACLARGYHMQPAATAERFIPDPFSGRGGRLYRTGDQVRWRADGIIEYLGRLDQQVKVRGFRVELGEIEAALGCIEQVADAVATLHQGAQGGKLLAYVVAAAGATLDGAALRAQLARRLPDYMVPAAVMVLEALPISPNGKIDRKALPPPAAAPRQITPPATELERQLARIWREVLQLPQVGVDDNFFELGGDSLSALKVLCMLDGVLPGHTVGIVDLFNYPDIGQLAKALNGQKIASSEVVHLRRGGTRPMLYCFPGLLVSTRDYAALVDFLGPEQPATGFICHSLSAAQDGAAPGVAAQARRYADYIRAHSAGQPCILLGWSWGGILAFEAARLLADSVDVKFVGMLDVCALDAEFAVGGERPMAAAGRARLQGAIDAWLAGSAMSGQWLQLFERMDATVYTQFLHYVNNSPDSLPLDGPDIGSREHIFWTLMDNALLFRDYALEPFDCRIHAWIAEDSLLRGMNVIDWRQYSARVERVDPIPGSSHLSIIGDPQFHRSFAHSLEQALARHEYLDKAVIECDSN